MNTLEITKQILKATLQLGSEVDSFDRHTLLLGGLPEFNSLTITTIIMEIENQLDCVVEDSELTAEVFESLGSLADFIESKIE